MRHAPLLVAALVAVVAFAPPVLAKDEDVATMLRQAIVAQDVEKDPQRARELLERVWSVAPGTESGLHAALRLEPLMKDRAKRLDLLKDVTKLHTTRMSDDVKKQVHDAMARLVKPGDIVKTPLGNLLVAPEPKPLAASPVESKITRIFRAHQVSALPFRRRNEGALRDLQRELEALGEAGKLVLRRMTREGHPDQAFSAGVLLRGEDPAATVEGYARALRTGRATFRSQVASAALKLEPGPRVSKQIVETFRPLLDLEHISDVHVSIVQLMAKHMSDDELLALCREKSPLRASWFRWALARSLPKAVELLTQEVAAGGKGLDELRTSIMQHQGGPGNQVTYKLDISRLSDEAVMTLFRLCVDDEIAMRRRTDYRLWRRLGNSLRTRGLWKPIREATWRRAFDSDDPEIRRLLRGVLFSASEKADTSRQVPERIFKTEADWKRMADLIASGKGYVLASWMTKSEPLWQAALDRIRADVDRKVREQVASNLTSALGERVPEALWPAALEDLRKADHSKHYDGTPNWMWSFAAKTKDPGFLALVRENLQYLHRSYGVRMALKDYQRAGGPGVVDFAIAVLDAEPTGLDSWALTALLGAHENPAAWKRLIASAKSANGALILGSRLSIDDPKQKRLLLDLYRWAHEGVIQAQDGPSGWRQMLVSRARRLRLREAVPFLLKEYEAHRNDNDRKQVIAALDTIRDHHDRLAFFRTWGQEDPGAQKAIAMLDDEDPAIRRAAVLSLAVMQGPRALPRLLEIAKNDKDAGVRKAALEMIDRVATMPREGKAGKTEKQ